MHLIPTARKEKLPKGFSYPLGAEAISEALDGVPHLAKAAIWFDWRDEYWASDWRKKIESRGPVKLLEVGASPLTGEPVVYVYSVPSEYSATAREYLLGELPRVRRQLFAAGRSSETGRTSINLKLSGVKAAANNRTQRTPR